MFGTSAAHNVDLAVSEVAFYRHKYPVDSGLAAGIQPAELRMMIWELCKMNY